MQVRDLEFEEPQPRPAKLAWLIYGETGAGKTHTAILIGNVLGGGPPAVINTEGKGTLPQIGKQPFREVNLVGMENALTLENVVGLIKKAFAQDFKSAVVDSITRIWDGPGGVLEQKDRIDREEYARRHRVNTFAGWKFIAAVEEELNDVVAFSERGHVIYTAHLVPDTRQETNAKGEVVVVDYGNKPSLRRKWTRHLDCIVEVVAETQKDGSVLRRAIWRKNRFDFPPFNGPITAENLQPIVRWCNSQEGIEQKRKMQGAEEIIVTIDSGKDVAELQGWAGTGQNEVLIFPGQTGAPFPLPATIVCKAARRTKPPLTASSYGSKVPVYDVAFWEPYEENRHATEEETPEGEV
jgi:hypothetical protein